ncbi:hypothetical protein ACFSY7_04545 [Kurthia populi]|uniref:Lipoprotein n=1 Tax=Kurthia populi TaxID=1562132 RepID=A0ABW5XXR2_9BACL
MKKVFYGTALAAVLLLGACSSDDAAEDAKTEATDKAKDKDKDTEAVTKETNKKVEEKIAKKNEGAVEKKADFKTDEDVKKAIEKEKGVDSANVLVTEANGKDYVMVDITVSNDSKAKAKKLATKYAKSLKKQHAKKIVDVRVILNQDVLAQKTLK